MEHCFREVGRVGEKAWWSGGAKQVASGKDRG